MEGITSEDNPNQISEGPAVQSVKSRVCWSVDLHMRFVAAVHQLGIDKAEPQTILHLINVEGLTRENVAIHLQKYRLYLQRDSLLSDLGRPSPYGLAPSLIQSNYTQNLSNSNQDKPNQGSENFAVQNVKSGVTWSADLHEKFVAAVYQLGIDKATPESILGLINDEGLTRENVATHLQKYRLYLQRGMLRDSGGRPSPFGLAPSRIQPN